jgi:hypothetical protein
VPDAASRLTPHRELRSRALPQGESGERAAPLNPTHAQPLPRRGTRPAPVKQRSHVSRKTPHDVGPPKGDGAPGSANLWRPYPRAGYGGRLTARHIRFGAHPRYALLERKRATRSKRMFICGGYGGGPRFSVFVGSRPHGPVERANTSQPAPLAGTRNGPGGSPAAARVLVCERQARGRRTPSRNHDASRERPFKWTR